MKEEKLMDEAHAMQAKKVYVKPVICKVRLEAEEAVLAVCKLNNTIRDACLPAVSCVRQQAS